MTKTFDYSPKSLGLELMQTIPKVYSGRLNYNRGDAK